MTTSSAGPTTAPTRIPDRTAAPADTGPWVGRPLDRADGTAKATGSATFSAEYQVPDIAHAVLVHASIARGPDPPDRHRAAPRRIPAWSPC